MAPILRLPNARPGHPRLTVNHLQRLANSMNRQRALYGRGGRYNANAVVREQQIRHEIAREVGMSQRNIAPYYHKYMNLKQANIRKRGRLSPRVASVVRTAAARFRNRPRMSAMRGQMASVGIPREVRNIIASMMLTPSPYRRPSPRRSARRN